MKQIISFALVFKLVLMLGLGTAFAKELRIAVGLTIPPYVIKEEARGIEFDILKETLALAGYTMKPIYVPLSRTLAMLKGKQVDGIMSTGQYDLPGCYTDIHVTYWNFAITLKEKNFDIKSPADLNGLRIAAFQNAHKYLGEEFAEMAASNPSYREVADQSSQNKLLFNDRTDVVIGDRYIFEWYRNDPEVKKFADVTKIVEHHNIFPPSDFPAVFQDEEICVKFNAGLKQLKDSGRYAEIFETYNTGGLTQ